MKNRLSFDHGRAKVTPYPKKTVCQYEDTFISTNRWFKKQNKIRDHRISWRTLCVTMLMCSEIHSGGWVSCAFSLNMDCRTMCGSKTLPWTRGVYSSAILTRVPRPSSVWCSSRCIHHWSKLRWHRPSLGFWKLWISMLKTYPAAFRPLWPHPLSCWTCTPVYMLSYQQNKTFNNEIQHTMWNDWI